MTKQIMLREERIVASSNASRPSGVASAVGARRSADLGAPLIRQSAAPPVHREMRPAEAAVTEVFSGLDGVIDSRKLRYFVNIVSAGSFSAAAVRLHIAQPALSHHVRELETALGVDLLTRSAHGVVATEAGSRLYEHGVNILRGMSTAAAELKAMGAKLHGRVRVGVPTSTAAVMAVPVVEAVRARAPQIELRLVEGESAEIRTWLDNGRLDLALLHDVPDTAKLTCEQLLVESLYLVGPPSARSAPIAFAEAAALPLILPGQPHGLRERLEREAQRARVHLNVTIEIDSVPNIRKLVRTRMGYAILAGSEVFEDSASPRLPMRPITDPALEQTLSLCHLKDRLPSRSIEHVRGLLLEVIAGLADRTAWRSVHGARAFARG